MATKRVPKNFKDLNLSVNDVFSVETLSGKQRYPVRLIGWVDNQSLIVTAPRVNGKEFYLKEDTLLKVRLIADNYACGFQTKVLVSHRSPFLYSHLAYPSNFEAVAVRQASRVKMSLPVEIREAQAGSLIGDWPRKETIVDVSHSGARIQSVESLAAVGSELVLHFEVTVDTIKRHLEVPCVVRNIAEVSDSVVGEAFQYGVQFDKLSDNDRVYICGYVYEQMIYYGNKAKVGLSK